MTDQPDPGRAPDGGPRNPPPPPPVGDRIVELTAQLTRLRRQAETAEGLATQRHQELGRDLADVRADLRRDIEDLVAQLRRETETYFAEAGVTLREHAASIDRILNRQQRLPPVQPVPWHLLTVAAATHEWERLAQWIDDVFVPWGEITREQLPDCWALHRPMLTQLSWLHTTHLQAYRPDSDPALAADWHLRWAPAVLRKIRDARNPEMCRPGEHMISQEESNRRRAEAFTNRAEAALAQRVARVTLGADQLATREFWEAFYLDARRADLTWRAGSTQPASAPEHSS